MWILLALILQATALSPQGKATLNRLQVQSKSKADALLQKAKRIDDQIRAELAKPAPNTRMIQALRHDESVIMTDLSGLSNGEIDSLLDQLSPADRLTFLKRIYPSTNVPPRVYVPGKR